MAAPVANDRYTLVRQLGAGGMGEVWEAVMHGPGGFEKPVAVKRLRSGLGQGPGRQLLEEARVGALLHHPNVVGVYGVDEDTSGWRVAMELVRGPTLAELLAKGPLAPAAVVEVGVQVAAALEHVHALRLGDRPLVHRDVKPQNLLVDRYGVVKLADFGIAGAADEPGAGTVGYAPPEQVDGRAEPRSDLFALGMTLAACALGRRPLGSSGAALAATFDIEARLPALQAEVDAAVPGLGPVVARCLRFDAAARYPSATALAAALRGLRGAYPPDLVLRQLVASARPELALARDSDSDSTLGLIVGNLPTPREGFVGRVDELADLLARLQRGERLVTVLGPGGAGKTRLSLQVAAREQQRVEGGAWFVDLSEATTADGVRYALAEALGIELEPRAGPAALGAALRARGRLLVVFDNVEQVVEAAAPLLSAWSAAAPQLSMICTSRVALDVRGEQRMFLGPLREDEAVALFLARSGRSDHPAVVRPVVELLEGSPLAIELAAARAATLTLDQLRERLEQGILALRSTQRDLPARQRSLEASLVWSWELLGPSARAALSRLSVCEGGFDSHAAEAILSRGADDPWALDVLQELVFASLVRADRATGRFSVLVSVRAFAAARLSAAELADAERLHARWYAQYVTHPAAPHELDNFAVATQRALRAGEPEVAARAALSAWKVVNARGPMPPGIRLLRAALAQNGPGTPHYVALVSALAYGLDESGDPPAAASLLRGALEFTSAPELFLRLAATETQVPAERSQLLDLAEAGFSADGDNEGLVWVCLGRAKLLLDDGRGAATIAELDRALALASTRGNDSLLARIHGALGTAHAQIGHLDTGRMHLTEARRMLEALGHRGQLGYVLSNLASTERALGRLDEADDLYTGALRLLRETGARSNEAVTVLMHGRLAMDRYDLPRARDRLTEAVHLLAESQQRSWHGYALYQLAKLSEQEGRLSSALEHLADAQQLLRDAGGQARERATFDVLQADLERQLGRGAGWLPRVREALVVMASGSGAQEVAAGHRVLGSLLEDAGDLDGAAAAFAVAFRHGLAPRAAEAGAGLARVAAARGEDPGTWLDRAGEKVADTRHRAAWALVLATRAALTAHRDPAGAAACLAQAVAVCPPVAPLATTHALATARAVLAGGAAGRDPGR
jgi:predicted ATPase